MEASSATLLLREAVGPRSLRSVAPPYGYSEIASFTFITKCWFLPLAVSSAAFASAAFRWLKSNRAILLADWLNTPQNSFRRSGSVDLLRLLRLTGAFFSPLALPFF